jgi:hypothetical protein
MKIEPLARLHAFKAAELLRNSAALYYDLF